MNTTIHVLKTVRNLCVIFFILDFTAGFTLDKDTCFNLQESAFKNRNVYMAAFIGIGACQIRHGFYDEVVK